MSYSREKSAIVAALKKADQWHSWPIIRQKCRQAGTPVSLSALQELIDTGIVDVQEPEWESRNLKIRLY